MPDPTLVLTIASDANYAAQGDAYDGTVTTVAPPAGMLTQGVRPHSQLAAQYRNWIDRQFATLIGNLYATPVVCPCRPVNPYPYSAATPPNTPDRLGSASRPVNFNQYTVPREIGFVTGFTNTAGAYPYPYTVYLVDLSPYLRNGALLTSAVLTFVAAAHAAYPQVFPAFGIVRIAAAAESLFDAVAIPSANRLLSTTSTQFVAPSSSAPVGYNGNNCTITFTPDQNNVIDKTTYSYTAVIWDEGGWSSTVGNHYMDILLTMAAV